MRISRRWSLFRPEFLNRIDEISLLAARWRYGRIVDCDEEIQDAV
jgi:hypothetical protein